MFSRIMYMYVYIYTTWIERAQRSNAERINWAGWTSSMVTVNGSIQG